MLITEALSLLALPTVSVGGCSLGLAIASAVIGAALHSALPPASGSVQEALLRATIAA